MQHEAGHHHWRQDPTERIAAQERRFQQLLEEKRQQDEQLAELYEAVGVDPNAPIDEELLESIPEGVRRLFEEEDASVRPAPQQAPLQTLKGFVVRG